MDDAGQNDNKTKFVVPSDEKARLAELRDIGIIESDEKGDFDYINELSASVFRVPVAYISFMEENLQWFKSTCGLDMTYNPREDTICRYTVYEQKPLLVVQDVTQDWRFKNHGYVKQPPYIRFYAGALIKGPKEGRAIGTMCLMDFKTRAFGPTRQKRLRQFADLVEHHIKLLYEQRQDRHQSMYLYYFDPLTDLPNKKLFTHYLARTLEHDQQKTVIITAINISDYARLRHQLSERDLNAVLFELVDRLQKQNDQNCTIAHEGGGCFLLFAVMKHADQASVTKYVDDLSTTIKQPFTINNEPLYLDMTIGVSLAPKDGEYAADLIEKARDAQQTHTENPLGHFNFYNPSFRRAINEYVALENKLIRDLECRKLDVALQPLVRLSDGQKCGYEALCRCFDASYGKVSPAEFIPIYFRLSKMDELTSWVLDRVCYYISFFKPEEQPTVAVNVTFQSLSKPHMHKRVKEIARKYGVKLDRLQMEITEDDLVNHFDQACQALEQLRQEGIKFAIDDFGTGYSALNYLTRLPVDKVKIDKSLIEAITTSKKDAKLVRLIIQLNRELGYESIAEGIETPEQARILQAYRCDIGQGFYWGYPELITDQGQLYL